MGDKMEFKNIILEKKEGIAKITMNRPKVLNALNLEVLEELSGAIKDIKDDEEVKGVIITGAGRSFVAGADISAMLETSPLEAKKFCEMGQKVFCEIENLTKPKIAAINGFALGGGLELALACDIRIASKKAKIGLPEVSLGIMPGWGGTQRLPRLVGTGLAKEIILTGDPIDAERGEKIGLVNKVVAPEDLESSAVEMLEQIMSRGPVAIGAAISAIDMSLDVDLDSGLAYEKSMFSICFSTEDSREGISAFLEKRKPEFKGR